jgi:hypothetical protein
VLGSTGPMERKVAAATGGSGLGVALAGVILWVLDTYAFRTSEVPDPLVVLVWAVVPVALTLAGGWLARHTPRDDEDAVAGRHAVDLLADHDWRAAGRPDLRDTAERLHPGERRHRGDGHLVDED